MRLSPPALVFRARAFIPTGVSFLCADAEIEDLILVGSRKAKRLSADELVEQMSDLAKVTRPRGYPFRFASKAQFDEFTAKLKAGLNDVGLPLDDVRIQGSAMRSRAAKDVDIAVLIDDSQVDTLLVHQFSGGVRLSGESVTFGVSDLPDLVRRIEADKLLGTKRFNAPARTLAFAFKARKIRPQDVAGLRALKKALEAAFGELDISVISKGSGFDLQPFLRI